jgi:FlaG/FlaF family flagellin (archaellin)
MTEQQEVLTTTEARQASPKRMNLRVLATSLIMAIVVAAVLYAVFYGGTTQVSTPDPAPTQSTAPGP